MKAGPRTAVTEKISVQHAYMYETKWPIYLQASQARSPWLCFFADRHADLFRRWTSTPPKPSPIVPHRRA
jgi:hypothetical protein